MKIDDKMKAYGLGIISAFVLLLSVIGLISLFNGFKTPGLPVADGVSNMYATVYRTGNGEIVVDPIDEEIEGNYTIKTDKEFNVGDFVLVDGSEVTLIATSDDLEDVTTTSTTTSKTTTERVIISTSTTKTTTTTNKKTTTTKKKTTTKVVDSDEEVISYVKSVNESVEGASEETFGSKVKSGFITVVDFIFYEGEIKGVTFSELSTSAKAKVVYYALLADSKIDEKFPGYKETISAKYNDLKAKLVAKYLDITTSICNSNENNQYHCEIVKQDFELLKNSVGITWDLVVDAFKYGYDKTTAYLKTWYETFSGK